MPTGTATGHNDTKAESTTPVDTETEDLTGDSEDAEDAARDDPQADADPHILELARAKANLEFAGRGAWPTDCCLDWRCCWRSGRPT